MTALSTTSESQGKAVSDVLRVVPEENSFRFYNAVDSPAGMEARSLSEFVSQIGNAPPESIQFHSQRHDFENWIQMLGDPTLAKQVNTLSTQNLTPEELKSKLLRISRMRVGKLRKLARVG